MIKIRKINDDYSLLPAIDVIFPMSYLPSRCLVRLKQAYEEQKKPKGLAAPQIGEMYRIVICRIKKETVVMINPVIDKAIGKWRSNEGCESVIGRYIVKRPLFGRVQYYTEQGKFTSKRYGYKVLRVICHEVDHLNGICINMIGKKWSEPAWYKNLSSIQN